MKDLDKEIWKTISISDKFYEVSNLGRVRNGNTKQILTPRSLKSGYTRVHISTSTGRKDFYIHRLVAEAFCEHPEGCDIVNHIDNNCSNNCASNLEWVKQWDNVLYAMNQNRVPNFPNAKPVIGQKGNQILEFRSIHEAANFVGCDHKGIQRCCAGKQQTCYGYKWSYKEE